MRVGLFIFTALCFFHTSIHSQEIHTEHFYLKLDSLLLNNRIEKFLAAFENRIDIETLDNKNEEIDFYQKVISKLNSLQNITPSRSKTFVNTYSKLSTAFTEENAGSQSNKAFENFLAFLSDKDTSNALTQINIAFCFKERFIADKRKRILSTYEKANFYYNTGNGDSAVIMVKRYQDEIKSVKSLSYIKDSLKIRSNLLKDKALWSIVEQRQMRNPVISDKFQIGYSFGMNFSLNIGDNLWPYNGRFDPKHVLVKTGKLNSRFDKEDKFTLSYFVFHNLSVAIEYDFGELSYLSPALIEGFVSKDTYTVRNKILSIVFNHYFNNHVGFRQFIGMGFGYADFDAKIDMTEIIVYEYFYNIFTLDTDHLKQHATLVSLRFGADYLLSKPNLIFGIHLNYTYIMEDIFYINKNIFKLSLSTGYHF